MNKYILGVIVILLTGSVFVFMKSKDQKIEPDPTPNIEVAVLEKKGYSKEEAKVIKLKLTEEQINHILQFGYIEKLEDILNEEYFLSSNIDRYIEYESNNDLDSTNIVRNVNSNLDYDFYTNTRSADLSKGYLILVNKFYKLDENYEPDDLVFIDSKYSTRGYIRKDVYDAFMKVVKDAEKEGLHIINTSSYRSYQVQSNLYNGYVFSEGKAQADRSSARAGFSEHQTGLALDLQTATASMYEFGNTAEGRWMALNAHKYGFILRYPKDMEYLTGYYYEPWHYRYLGVETATKVYESGLTYDEYYAYYLDT